MVLHASTNLAFTAQEALMRGKELQQGVGGFRAYHAHQLLARRAAHAGQTSKSRQQHLSAPGSNARHVVELGSQISTGASLAVEADRETMRFITDPL
jgi:hypothetical protein